MKSDELKRVVEAYLFKPVEHLHDILRLNYPNEVTKIQHDDNELIVHVGDVSCTVKREERVQLLKNQLVNGD